MYCIVFDRSTLSTVAPVTVLALYICCWCLRYQKYSAQTIDQIGYVVNADYWDFLKPHKVNGKGFLHQKPWDLDRQSNSCKCSKACHRPLRFNDVVFFAPQPHKFTALHMAVEQDKNGIIQLLLSQEEINVNACDEVSL